MGKPMTHYHNFIHPLVGTNDLTCGYLVEQNLLGKTSPVIADSVQALPIAENILAHDLFSTFDQRHPWLIASSQLGSGHSDQIIPVFSGIEGEASSLETELRLAKRRLAIEASATEKLPASGSWDYLILTIGHARTQPPFALTGIASRTQIITTGVHGHSDHQWAVSNGCALSTGEYLLARQQGGKKADTTRQRMLRLLSLVAQDADTKELETIFRQETKLAYSLLRLVNSAAIAPRTPITSFIQAINLLGRRQLERWLQLLIYADPDNGHLPNPLLYKAAVRGRMMELLLPHLNSGSDTGLTGDAAFMTGCFSLLDALLNLSMSDILMQLPLPKQINDILLQYSGEAGQLLLALKATDMRNLPEAERHLQELEVDPVCFIDAQMRALHWAAGIQQL